MEKADHLVFIFPIWWDTFWKMGYGPRKWINLNMVKFVSGKKREKWLADIEHSFSLLK